MTQEEKTLTPKKLYRKGSTSSDEMVDVLASKASVERRVGSSPTLRTNSDCMLKVLEFPMREQKYDFDCSVAAGWSLLKYCKIKVDYNTILKASKVCPVDGLSPIKLVNLLKKFGLNVSLKERTNIRFLKGQIKADKPIILLLQHRKEYRKSWKNTWIYGHYAVLFGYDEKRLFLYNPSIGGIKVLTYDQLNNRWHDDWNGGEFIKTAIVID